MRACRCDLPARVGLSAGALVLFCAGAHADGFSEFNSVTECARVAQSFFSRPYRTGAVITTVVQALTCLPTIRRPYGTRPVV